MFVAQAIIRASSALNRVALWGAVLAAGVMVFAAIWQVVARYVFASPPIWTEELARYAMVWAGMLGASCAFHSGADPVLFPGALDAPGRRGLVASVVRAIAIAVFAGPVLWFCVIGPNGAVARGYIARSLDRNAEMLGIPMFWIAIAIPVAFTLICIHAVAGIAARTLPASRHSDPDT